jgi:colicin import membrane protein
MRMPNILKQLKLVLLFSSGLCLAVYTITARADVEQIQKLIATGNLNEALTQTNRELAKDENNVTYRFLKGLVLTRQDKLDQARDIFVGITRSNPELPEPYNNLAVIYAALGDFDKARLALEEAINTHPAYATAHENIGDIYAKLASQAYNQALELDGHNNTAKAKLSLVNELFSIPASVAPQALLASAEAAQPVTPVTVVASPVPQPTPPVPTSTETTTIVPVTPEPLPTPAPAVIAPIQTVQVEPAQSVSPPVTAAARVEVQTEALTRLELERRQIALIKQTVLDWASVWSAQDINAYLSYYASDFTPPDGRTINQWRDLRRQRLSAPGAISVVVSDLVVEMLGGEHAQATFTQVYSSNVYNDRVKKTLLLKLEQNKWLITLEKT